MGGGPILSIDSSGGIAIVGIHKGEVGSNPLTDGTKIVCKWGRVMTGELVEELKRVTKNMRADPFLIANT